MEFNATSHGKSVVDGIEVVIQQLTAIANLQGAFNNETFMKKQFTN